MFSLRTDYKRIVFFASTMNSDHNVLSDTDDNEEEEEKKEEVRTVARAKQHTLTQATRKRFCTYCVSA